MVNEEQVDQANSSFYRNSDHKMLPEWRVSNSPVDYEEAVSWMEQRVAAIAAGLEPECIWLIEHPPLYTAGTSANREDLLIEDRFPVYKTGRGGQYTYHGPGQRIAYVLLNLKQRRQDIRAFIFELEAWIIDILAELDVPGERKEGRVGVWIDRPDGQHIREDKIAAIGVRVRRWITFHGISLNICPDLSHYAGINPCGVKEHGVTSLRDLGLEIEPAELDRIIRSTFENRFGPTL